MMSYAQKIGYQAYNGARDSSQGACLRYVGNAVQRARGQAQTNIGINSAKDSAPFFTQRGFVSIGKISSGFQNGDLVIFDSSPGHPHGHVQIYYKESWHSDFHQKRFTPYKDGTVPDYQVYRVK